MVVVGKQDRESRIVDQESGQPRESETLRLLVASWVAIRRSIPSLNWSFANFPAAGRTKPQIAIPAIKTPGATRGHRGKWIMS